MLTPINQLLLEQFDMGQWVYSVVPDETAPSGPDLSVQKLRVALVQISCDHNPIVGTFDILSMQSLGLCSALQRHLSHDTTKLTK